MAATNKSKEQGRAKELECSDRYYYNRENDSYVVFIRHLAKNIVITGETHRGMLYAYSGEDQRSVDEICTTFNVPHFIFNEYKSIFGWTRDSVPLSAEQIIENTIEESVETLVERKKFEIIQKFNKQDWGHTQDLAKKWIEFETKVKNPFDSFVKNIKPVPFKNIVAKAQRAANKHMIIGLSDVHYGAHSEPRYLFNKGNKGWSIDDTNKAIDRYCEEIVQYAESFKHPFKSVQILSLGDILHTLSGSTAKGTPIEAFPIGEEQWDLAFNSLVRFFSNIIGKFNVVSVKSITGNHDLRDATLFKCLKAYFRNCKNINFEIYDSRWCAFNVGGCGIIAEHGYSPIYNRAKLPRKGPARDLQVQKLIWEQKDKFKDSKQILYLSADQHHFEANECGSYTQIMFSTIVEFDRYADNHNLRGGRPQQNALIIDESGLKEIISFYLD